MRVAILSHGHRSVSPGGAEISAHSLHGALAAQGVPTLLVSCVPPGLRLQLPADEVTVETAQIDPLYLHRHDAADHHELVAALRSFAPDIVHFHHILGFGADALLAVRKSLPAAHIVLTLHEYIAICHRQGQMLRTDGELCHRASPADCSRCFPEHSPAQFLMRQAALHATLSVVDAFVAPSHFLASRYRDWGLPAERLSVIENAVAAAPSDPQQSSEPTGRLAFFGQINPFKGLEVLLEAVSLLADDVWRDRRLDVHGSGLDRQPADFRAKIEALVQRCGKRVTMHGPYRNADISVLMAEADWIVVPSIWWENSPVVIQEAFRARKPVIGSDLGGIAEKVRPGVDGLLFQVGDAEALASCLAASADPALWRQLQRGVQSPPPPAAIAAAHLRLYAGLRQSSSVTEPPVRPELPAQSTPADAGSLPT